MDHPKWIQLVQQTVDSILQDLNKNEISELAGKISEARRIFLMASGRTGLITKAFGMRLAQLGLAVHIVDQPTTPALEEKDFLVLFSGSGKTESLILAARKAAEIGAETYLVTQKPDSPAGNLVPKKLIIPSPPKNSKVLNGTLFELSQLIVLDAVINQLLELTGQSYDDMTRRHANLG